MVIELRRSDRLDPDIWLRPLRQLFSAHCKDIASNLAVEQMTRDYASTKLPYELIFNSFDYFIPKSAIERVTQGANIEQFREVMDSEGGEMNTHSREDSLGFYPEEEAVRGGVRGTMLTREVGGGYRAGYQIFVGETPCENIQECIDFHFLSSEHENGLISRRVLVNLPTFILVSKADAFVSSVSPVIELTLGNPGELRLGDSEIQALANAGTATQKLRVVREAAATAFPTSKDPLAKYDLVGSSCGVADHTIGFTVCEGSDGKRPWIYLNDLESWGPAVTSATDISATFEEVEDDMAEFPNFVDVSYSLRSNAADLIYLKRRGG